MPENLLDLLILRAKTSARKGYYFVEGNDGGKNFLSFGDLETKSGIIAAELSRRIPFGERVLLFYPQGLDYIAAFFGCLRAGLIAVPTYLPGSSRNLERLVSIIENSSARFALTNSASYRNIKKLFDDELQSHPLDLISSDELTNRRESFLKPEIGGDDIAFLQYTSGSTKNPRGVIVTHRNLLHNSQLLKKAFNYDGESHCVSWLPMYHDMGLIGGVLQPLYGGYSCTLMSPSAFLQSPVRWLQVISDANATISGSPNFGYDLCVKKISYEQLDKVDLSSWKVAFNGAEPVSAETMDAFTKKFEKCGFDERAFFPCYGLAESTLFVSGGPYHSGAKLIGVDSEKFAADRIEESPPGAENTKILASSGQLDDAERRVEIVDKGNRRILADGNIGEIWVSGESVAKGYWNDLPETKDVFNLRLRGGTDEKFLATGDLGFIKDGLLFVTGRIKDLIIIRGVNHYPQDIEKTITDTDSALSPNGCAAFSITKDSEILAVVVELRHPKSIDLDDLILRIRQNIAKNHGVEAGEILLTKASKIPKTTSGKIQRSKCRSLYLDSYFPVIKKWSAFSESDSPGAGKDEIFATETPDPFGEILSFIKKATGTRDETGSLDLSGLDSLKITELQHAIEQNAGVEFSFAELLQIKDFDQLTDRIRQKTLSKDAENKPIETGEYGERGIRQLSAGQKGFLFLHQVYEEVSPDNIFIAAEINHEINLEHLEKSLKNIVEKHEILRTRYEKVSDEYRPETLPLKNEYLNVADVEDSATSELRQLVSAEIYKPFDIERSLFAFNLYRVGENKNILLLKFHHSIADYWSLRIIVKDLLKFYDSYENGRLPEIGASRYEYSDFVNRQKAFAESPESDEHLKFWKRRLEGRLPVLSLPIGKRFTRKNTFRGGNFNFHFDAGLTSKLKKFSSQSKVSLYATLFASYYALLYRYTGQKEQIIGSPFSGRISADWAETVGYFVNPLPVRLKIEESDNFSDVQKKLRAEILELSEKQKYHFNLLVEKIKPERVEHKNPVFQTLFVFQNQSEDDGFSAAKFALGEAGGIAGLGNLTLESFEVENKAAQFELSIYLAETGREISGKIEFNTDIFDAEAIRKFSTSWKRLLEQAIEHPNLKINLLELTAKNEIENQTDFGATVTAKPFDGKLIHQIFENQARKTPEDTALVCGENKLNYRELNRRAGILAAHLRKRGIGAEDLVGICLPRAENLVISILAVLKSGGGYVPLDANYPPERLSYISKESKIKLLLTQKNRKTDWLDETVEKIFVDETEDVSEYSGSTDDGFSAGGDSRLAYVIYTSGSTGKPKGVAIEHRSVAAFLSWCHRVFSTENLKFTLASTSINFDLSIFEIFAPLTCGGTVVMVENALFLQEIAEKSKITLLNTVPSTMNEIVKLNLIPEEIQVINLAGEPLKKNLVAEIYADSKVEKVFNLYGPSEDTTYTTVEPVGRDEEKITIGKPIDETEIYLLNKDLQLVPEGAVGEIHVGGRGLARGYFGNGALTAEKFLPNPFSSNGSGERMYATGDLAKYLPDGRLDYLGRIDNQVKVRGFRIELGEIETVLSRHPQIRESAVITKENSDDETQLTAFLIPADKSSRLSAKSIRAYLKEKLPDYMIPQFFSWLEDFPLTPNRKIDRSALKNLEVKSDERARAVAVSMNSYQQKTAEIWQEVLSIEKIGPDDNFFDLGGTSLQITRVAARLKESFQIDFSLQEIYDCFTVRKQAELVEELKKKFASSTPVSKIKPVSRASRKVGIISE